MDNERDREKQRERQREAKREKKEKERERQRERGLTQRELESHRQIEPNLWAFAAVF